MTLEPQFSRLPLVRQVQALSLELAHSLKQLGVEKPTRLPIQTQLEGLGESKLMSIAQSLSEMQQTLIQAQELNIDPWHSSDFMKLGLNRLGYNCSQEFWNTVGEEDLIEAYTVEHMQLFRNMKFMEICGYSLMEILSYDWPALFERSQVVTNRMIELMGACVSEEKIFKMDTPVHYMKERMARSRQVVRVDFRYVAPLYTGPGKVRGYIISCKADLVDEEPERHELRFL